MSEVRWEERLGLMGAFWGLIVSAALWTGSLFMGSGPITRDIPQALAGLVVCGGPFAISLIALRAGSPFRGGILIGSGIVAMVLVYFLLISGVALLLLPGAILLIISGARAVRAGSSLALGLLVTVIMAVLATGGALLLAEQSCWYRVTGGEGDTWVKGPYTPFIHLRGRVTEGVCGSSATPASAGAAVGAWLLPGWLALRREAPIAEPGAAT
jgi:hypothetical protein